MFPEFSRVCVIGGGAAGFYSAISCAEAASTALRRLGAPTSPVGRGILVLERSADVLHKVRISGGGRCNVTHSCNSPPPNWTYPRGAALVTRLRPHHAPHDVVRWFQSRGVELKTEGDGRIFPVSDSSATIVNSLRRTADALGVQVRTGMRVSSIRVLDSTPAGASTLRRFCLEVQDSTEGITREVECNRVIVCCGSAQTRSVQRLLDSTSATLCATAPSLFSVLLEDSTASGLAGLEGVSVPDARVTLCSPSDGSLAADASGHGTLAQRGAVLITHGGLSGPAILRLSAFGAFILKNVSYRARLRVHWAPFLEAEDDVRTPDSADPPNSLVAAIQAVPEGRPGFRPPVRRKAVGDVSPWPGFVPARLWRSLVERSGDSSRGGDGCGKQFASRPWGAFRDIDVATRFARELWPALSNHEVAIDGRRVNKEEFVTAGGVNWRDGLVDLNRMESTVCPGIHYAGEVLDVDGVTGGFNFQGCWTTGYVAGRAAAEELLTSSLAERAPHLSVQALLRESRQEE